MHDPRVNLMEEHLVTLEQNPHKHSLNYRVPTGASLVQQI